MNSHDLNINDLFWTLQGEGHFSGHRALFIRLPYCNYDCPWCDTEYNSYKAWSEEDFLNFINLEKSRFAVITGGEPLVNKHLDPILKILKKNNFYIACETNGSTPAPKEIDFVTTSPKAYTKNKLEPYYINPQLLERTNEWKYVVDENFDFNILKRHEPFILNTFYSLSPEYSDMLSNINRIIEFIKENPKWRLSLQTHKWINIP
jgi:7-carboxy-7-deazaguanine synthase